MARTDNLTNYLTDVITAVKTKKGSQDTINAANLDTEIANLPSGSTTPDFVVGEEINLAGATNQDIADCASYLSEYYEEGAYTKDFILHPQGFINSTFTDASSLDNAFRINDFNLNNLNAGGAAIQTFYNNINLTRPPKMDFSKLNYYGCMFQKCSSLVSLPTYYFATMPSGVVNNNAGVGNISVLTWNSMFDQCTSLTTCPSELANKYPLFMNSMFRCCTNLVTCPTFKVDYTASLNCAFFGCENLEDVGFTFARGYPDTTIKSSVQVNLGSIFAGCYKLSTTSIDSFLQFLTAVVSRLKSQHKSLSALFSGWAMVDGQRVEYLDANIPEEFKTKVRASQYFAAAIDAGIRDFS